MKHLQNAVGGPKLARGQGTFPFWERRRGQGFRLAQRNYQTLEQTARFMGEPVESVRQRVDNKELPHVVIDGTVMIPALVVGDFYYDYLLKASKKGKKPGSTRFTVTRTRTSTATSLRDALGRCSAMRSCTRKRETSSPNPATSGILFGTPATSRAGSSRSSPPEGSSMFSRKWPRILRQWLVRRP